MKLRAWLNQRNAAYLLRRGVALIRRYRLGSTWANRRIERCVAALAEQGSAPTLMVPGRVAERHPALVRRLHQLGAELAVHGYEHVDLQAYAPQQAAAQLLRAAAVFRAQGIPVDGFRCPYLGCGDALIEALPPGSFRYSSNVAINWSLRVERRFPNCRGAASAVFKTLGRFYRALPGQEAPSTPHERAGLLEIPASVPDDLQLVDGLGLDTSELAEMWIDILEEVHRRRELFTVLFHAELADRCQPALLALVAHARRLRPPAWIAPLRDVAGWWGEQSRASSPARPAVNGVWPGGARCALTLTGDLDAFSLTDYASRLLAR